MALVPLDEKHKNLEKPENDPPIRAINQMMRHSTDAAKYGICLLAEVTVITYEFYFSIINKFHYTIHVTVSLLSLTVAKPREESAKGRQL